MNTSQKMGANPLGMAIANVSAILSRLSSNADNQRENELMYALKCVIMELNQYFAGGYCSFADVFENCGRVATLGMEIKHKQQWDNAGETLDSMAYDQQRDDRESGL